MSGPCRCRSYPDPTCPADHPGDIEPPVIRTPMLLCLGCDRRFHTLAYGNYCADCVKERAADPDDCELCGYPCDTSSGVCSRCASHLSEAGDSFFAHDRIHTAASFTSGPPGAGPAPWDRERGPIR